MELGAPRGPKTFRLVVRRLVQGEQRVAHLGGDAADYLLDDFRSSAVELENRCVRLGHRVEPQDFESVAECKALNPGEGAGA